MTALSGFWLGVWKQNIWQWLLRKIIFTHKAHFYLNGIVTSKITTSRTMKIQKKFLNRQFIPILSLFNTVYGLKSWLRGKLLHDNILTFKARIYLYVLVKYIFGYNKQYDMANSQQNMDFIVNKVQKHNSFMKWCFKVTIKIR